MSYQKHSSYAILLYNRSQVMATIANGTGKRRALKKTENNDKNRTSIDDTAVSKVVFFKTDIY